jgi:hypothetical protein
VLDSAKSTEELREAARIVVLRARCARSLRQAVPGPCGSFTTAADAREALQASHGDRPGVRVQDQRRLTVAYYLEAWLERKTATGRFRPSTAGLV